MLLQNCLLTMKAAVQAKIFAAAFYLHSASIQKSNLPLGYNFQLSFWLSMCMMLPKPKLSNLPFTNELLNVIMSCNHTTPFFCGSPTFVIFLWELIAFFWTHFGVYDRLLDTFLDFNLGCPALSRIFKAYKFDYFYVGCAREVL